VVDLNTNTIVRTIPTQNWTESMIRYDRFMFVTCIGNFNEPNHKRKAQILIVDTKLDEIVDSIETGKEPMGIVIDKKLKIWVLCSGGYDNFEPASLLRINPETRTVEKAFVFPGVKDVPSRLCINPAGDEMYYLMGGVFKVPVTAAELPTQEFIPSDGRLLYGLAVNPQNGNLFVSDAVDYVQEGKVYQYNGATGILIKSYNAGRIPGSFCFTSAAD
jgi:DNA-binding beta-propeller fold protein YncE